MRNHIHQSTNLLVGYIGVYAEKAGELTVFAGLATVLGLFALVLWFLAGKMVYWMHGAESTSPQQEVSHEP